jgi:hypothetical protein
MTESLERIISYTAIIIAVMLVAISLVLALREIPAMRRYLRMLRM